MIKAMVVRAGSGWGRALVQRLIGANVEVVAYSGSRRKLEALEETYASTPLLRTVRGNARNRSELLAAAEGVDVIFCGAYLNYDDEPEKVRRMLEAVRSVSAATGARTIMLEGVYLPADESISDHAIPPVKTSMRINSPELYGEGVSNTITHYALRKVIQGKPIKRLIEPSAGRDYLYVEDAARYVLELALTESAYGGVWNLRGNGPISQAELLDLAGSVIQTAPRFEPIDGWQMRLLQWYEPRVKKMLSRLEQLGDDSGREGTVFCDPSPTPYPESIASTIAYMMRKRDGGTQLD